MISFLAILIVTVLGAVAIIWKAFVLSLIWQWFLVAEVGIVPIGFLGAIGIILVIDLLTAKYENEESNSVEDTAKAIAFKFIQPAFVLLFAWIASQFI